MRLDTITIGIDPGSGVSGVCVLKNNTISSASIENNSEVFDKVKELIGGQNATVVIEDILPYSIQLKPQVITTCKFIGELSYRFSLEQNITTAFVARSTVKKWVFDTFPDICLPRISAKIKYLDGWREGRGERGLKTKTGELRKPSFQYVDDRVIIAAMSSYYGIVRPKPGKSNQYGLKAHSWQALAVATTYLCNEASKKIDAGN